MLLAAACVPPSAGTGAPSTADPVASPVLPGTCEFIGARFSVPAGFSVKEQRESREIVARATIEGKIGTHQILLDIIPKPVAGYGNDPAAGALARAYFDALKASSVTTKWSGVTEGRYAGPKRSYPAIVGVESGSSLGVATTYDNAILLYVPADLVRDGYFYSFFWTDIHLATDPRAPVTELEKLVDGFVVLGSPVGAPARGCR